ncbi:MAG: dihydrodipicolinate reductase C-terminal domain-containing protein [Ignavibacteriaceae bacterium]
MSSKIKYGLIGAGRLGSEVEAILNENNYQLVLKEDINGTLQSGDPEVLIDCSLPEAFPKTIGYAEKYNIPLVVATTGLTIDHIHQLQLLSEKIAIVQSFNYSVGIQVLLKLTQAAKKILGDWDIEITETHHRFKKDKPSGTAKMIKEIFHEKDIEVSSLRLGNIAGDHTVYFGGLGEVLSITHSATSRKTFAEGILKATGFVLTKQKGLYSFTDVVFPNG